MMSKPSSAPVAAVLAHEAVDGAGEVLGVDHADDVLGLAAKDRDAGVRRVDRLLEDLGGRHLGVDHLDVAAVHHHLLDLALAEVERAEEPVAVGLLHRPLGGVQRDRAGDLLLRGEEVGPRVDVDAEEPQDQPHEGAHRVHERREQRPTTTGSAARPAGRPGLGVGDGVGLGQDLGEDQRPGRSSPAVAIATAPRAEEAG